MSVVEGGEGRRGGCERAAECRPADLFMPPLTQQIYIRVIAKPKQAKGSILKCATAPVQGVDHLRDANGRQTNAGARHDELRNMTYTLDDAGEAV